MPVQIDPKTGERIASGMPQIDPATGERVGSSNQIKLSGPPQINLRPAGLPAGVDLPGFPDHAPASMAAPVQMLPTGFSPMHPVDNFRNNARMVPVSGSDHPIANAVQDISASTAANLGGLIRHPYDSAKAFLTFGKNDPVVARMQQAKDEWNSDPGLAIAHGLGDAATGVITDGVVRAPGDIGNMAGGGLRRVMTSGADEAIPGTDTTPRARYEAAKRVGVNLDLADATNHPIATSVKAVGRNSLAGEHVYDAANTRNIAALNDAAGSTLNDMSPLDREAGGVRLQDLLKGNQQLLKSTSDDLYSQIHEQFGNSPILNPQTLSDTALGISKEEAQHLSEFPSLATPKVGSVISDAMRFGTGDTPPTVSNALKARSGILDMYRNNPDLVKTASDAHLQRLVKSTHEAIMDSLPDYAQSDLRNAQTTFKEMKDVYDNPSSPLYDAVRTPNPSAKVSGIGPKTPESIRGIVARVGDEGRGILQRGGAEGLFGTKPGTDLYDFGRFPGRLSKLPSDYSSELYGDYLPRLRDISDTSQALSKELNPSGTAKQGQKIGEAVMALKTLGLESVAQYGGARLMNSPALVDWMMNDLKPIGKPATGLSKINTAAPIVLNQRNGTR